MVISDTYSLIVNGSSYSIKVEQLSPTFEYEPLQTLPSLRHIPVSQQAPWVTAHRIAHLPAR